MYGLIRPRTPGVPNMEFYMEFRVTFNLMLDRARMLMYVMLVYSILIL